MANTHARKPQVKRFGVKKTYAGRDIRKATVTRRNAVKNRAARPQRTLRSLKGGGR